MEEMDIDGTRSVGSEHDDGNYNSVTAIGKIFREILHINDVGQEKHATDNYGSFQASGDVSNQVKASGELQGGTNGEHSNDNSAQSGKTYYITLKTALGRWDTADKMFVPALQQLRPYLSQWPLRVLQIMVKYYEDHLYTMACNKEEIINVTEEMKDGAFIVVRQEEQRRKANAGGGNGAPSIKILMDHEFVLARRNMTRNIFVMALKRRTRNFTQPELQRFMDAVELLEEECLFNSAVSKEDYMSMDDIEGRLLSFVRRSHNDELKRLLLVPPTPDSRN